MSTVTENLKELGFPAEVYSTQDLLHLEQPIAVFIRHVNEAYRVYPYEDVSSLFSITSLCEPWFAGFLARALDIKKQRQKQKENS